MIRLAVLQVNSLRANLLQRGCKVQPGDNGKAHGPTGNPGKRTAVILTARVTSPAEFDAVVHLIRVAFADMDGRVDPPSSVEALDHTALAVQVAVGEVWRIGDPPAAAVFLTPKPGALYIGKLAVAEAHRRQGLARRLIALAQDRAATLGLTALELQTRVELTANHAAFRALGFVQTAATAHPGYDRPTSLTFRRPVPGPLLPAPPRPAPGSG